MGLVNRRPVDHHRVRSQAAGQGRAGSGRARTAADGLGRRLPLGGKFVMSDQIQIVLIAVGCASAVGLVGMGLIWLLRRASLRLSIHASSVVPVLVIAAGTLGTAKAMFLSQHDLGVVVMVCVIAGIVACAFSWLLGRQVASGSAALRQAARSLGDEADQFRLPGLPLAAEFATLSRELADTSAKLARSRTRERALEQSRRQLVAWVSHDLRTPLAGLRAMAEALEDGLAADPPRYHKQMRVEAERLATMVDDLFELSRIHAGTLQLAPDQIALDDLVSDVLASTEALAREHGVRLDGRASGQLAVRADPRELSRALTNLLANAIRHTPPGGCVRVEVRPQGGNALLAVADGCGGIPEADLPYVFDLAWRGTDARSPARGSGAGLGLAIVRGVVEAHQGSVRVANTGVGCCFEMTLPVCS